MILNFIFITFYYCFLLDLPLVKPEGVFASEQSNGRITEQKDMFNNENLAYPDVDYALGPAAEEKSWLQSQQSQETSKFLSNFRPDVPLNDDENDNENHVENIESSHINDDDQDNSFRYSRYHGRRDFRKFREFPKISTADDKDSLNFDFDKKSEQLEDSVNTDLSSCRQCSQQKNCLTNDGNMANKNVTEGNSGAFNKDKNLKTSKNWPAKGSTLSEEGYMKRTDDEDNEDDDWALLKFSVSNDKNRQNGYAQPLNDQLENTKNTLSHEADYKLSKMEQDNLENKNLTFWNWGIFKRSQSNFNPMHLIKLKTSDRLMKKGFSASLPSSSMEALQPQQEFVKIQEFAPQPLYNENEYGLSKSSETERYKRAKKINSRFKGKPVEKGNFNSPKSQNATESGNKLQNLESAANQEFLKVLETSKEIANLEKNLKAFKENNHNTRVHSRRKRSISSDTKSFKDLETQRKMNSRKQQETNFKKHYTLKINPNLQYHEKLNKFSQRRKKKKKSLVETKTKQLLRTLEQEKQAQVSFNKLTNSSLLSRDPIKTENILKTPLESKENFSKTESATQNLRIKHKKFKKASEKTEKYNNFAETFKVKQYQRQIVKSSKHNKRRLIESCNHKMQAIASRKKVFEKMFNKSSRKLLSKEEIAPEKAYKNYNFKDGVKVTTSFKKSFKDSRNTKGNSHFRAKRSIESFLTENHLQTNPLKNRFTKRYSPSKNQSVWNTNENQIKNDFGLYVNDEPLKEIGKMSHEKRFQNNARRQQTTQDNKSPKTKKIFQSQDFDKNPQESYKNYAKAFSKLTPDLLKDFSDSNNPTAVEALKNRYLSDLKNFNKNYKFNEYPPIDGTMPYLRNPNDNENNETQDQTLSLALRNEILNCEAFSSLEEFLKSKNVTQPLEFNNTSTERLELQLSTPTINTPSSNENSSTKTEDSATEVYQRPTTCFPLNVLEETTESSTQTPLDNCEDFTDSVIYTESGENYLLNENTTESKDLKLNITINAKVHGNPLGKDFYGNGSIEMLPGFMDDRKRREILWQLPQQNQKRKCAEMPTVKMDFLEDSEDINNLASGELSSKMVQTIFKRVKIEPSLKDLWPSLKPLEQTEKQKNSNFYALKNQNNEADVHHAEQLFAQAMASINNIIEEQLRSHSCITLRPDLQQFYNFILRSRQEQDLARAKRDMAKKRKQHNSNGDQRLQNTNEVQEKISTVKKFLKEYEALPEQEQNDMLSVKNELLKNLNELQQQNTIAERSQRGLKEVSHEDIKKTLQDGYTQEFLKLLKAANFYRASSNNAEPVI